MENQTHWTERSKADFQHRLVADFVNFIETTMEVENINQAMLAARLRVSEGRVSQVLNNPGNLTLKKMIEYARAVGRKISIVGYDDGDIANTQGPIHADIFGKCWERLGKPNDFFALDGFDQQLGSATLPQFNRFDGGRLMLVGLEPELKSDNSAQSKRAATDASLDASFFEQEYRYG